MILPGATLGMLGGGQLGRMFTVAARTLGYNVVDKPVHIHDLNATILHTLGVDHEKLTYRFQGRDFRLTLPSPHFRRSIGAWVGQPVTPEGTIVSAEAYAKHIGDWIPTEADRAFVRSLMQKVVEPGKMAAWIAPPDRGINNQPLDYAYVKLQ